MTWHWMSSLFVSLSSAGDDMAVGSQAIMRGGGGWSTWRDMVVMWGVEKGSDVAVVVIERGRQWGWRRGGGLCAVTWQLRVM